MECCIVNCQHIAKHSYSLGGVDGVKFAYCEGHKHLPNKIIENQKKGNYMVYREREVS